jgi:hypothetical protein
MFRHVNVLLGLSLSSLIFSLMACEAAAPSAPALATRDSSGITIAENSGVPPENGGGWSVSAEPTLQIGSVDGDEAYLFSRISGATRLPDGRIAVSDNRAINLRIFSPSGEHLHTFGGRGEGPGEFRNPTLMGALAGDTLVVVDSRLRRINLFHPETGFILNSTASSDIPGILLTEGMFSSGSVFVFRMSFGEDRSDGYTRRPVRYRAVTLGGDLEKDYGEFMGEELILATEEDGPAVMSIMGNSPYGKSATVGVGDDHFYYGSQDSYEVQRWSQEGTLERIIRVAKAPIPVSQADVADFIESELADLEDNNLSREYRRHYESAPIPEHHPAYRDFFVDVENHLWVEETRTTEDAPRMASIFDPDGQWVGTLSLPANFRVHEVGSDYVLGRITDDLGVQYLAMYSLTRPS